jgi:hypothetical protein
MRLRVVVTAVICALGGAAVAIPLASGDSSDAGKAGQRSNANKVLFGVLTGAKEVDQQGDRGVGDRNGRGTFTALIDGGRLCFGITVRNVDEPLAAHIHRGGKNVAGDIVIPLTQPDAGDPGTSSGCVPVTGDQAADLLEKPRRFYTNVHTRAFPGGAVRGQLFAKRR